MLNSQIFSCPVMSKELLTYFFSSMEGLTSFGTEEARRLLQVHLIHVIPKMQVASMYPGAPPVDFLPQQDPVTYEQLIKNAEHFITQRFLPKLGSMEPSPVVHVIRVSGGGPISDFKSFLKETLKLFAMQKDTGPVM